MIPEEIHKLRSRVEREVAELERSAIARKKVIRTSAEMSAAPSADDLDSARDERELKSQIRIHNHSMIRAAELKSALGRMSAGRFGLCLECGEQIGNRRLNAHPGAGLCIDCQDRVERAA